MVVGWPEVRDSANAVPSLIQACATKSDTTGFAHPDSINPTLERKQIGRLQAACAGTAVERALVALREAAAHGIAT